MGGRGSKSNGPKVGGGEKKPEAQILSRTETKGLVDVNQNIELKTPQFRDMYAQLVKEDSAGGKFDGLSPAARAAAEDYAKTGYKSLNQALRADKGPNQMFPQTRKTLNGLDEGMAKASFPRDAVVFRGRNSNLTEAQAKELIGTIGTDKGYGSTSLSFKSAATFTSAATGSSKATMYAYHVPKGAKAATMDSLMGKSGTIEHEVLLNRGYQVKYSRVETKKIDGVTYTIVHANVLT